MSEHLLDHPGAIAVADRPRHVVINRAPAPSEVQERLEQRPQRLPAGIVDPSGFADELATEFDRRRRGGKNCVVASISLFEIHDLRKRKMDSGFMFGVVSELIELLYGHLGPNDLMQVSEDADILIMARESSIVDAVGRVEQITAAIASRRFDERLERLMFTPSAGYATLDDGDSAATIVQRAVDAREVSGGHLDLSVQRWEPAMSPDTASPDRQPFNRFGWQRIKERLRAPVQIIATYALGIVVPFFVYWLFDAVIGVDISWGVYVLCVVALVLTGVMILVEARLAVDQQEPPEYDGVYPTATAIICAYLPNEASTIMETLDVFLDNGYPGEMQVILAYNTPNKMSVERDLFLLAKVNPSLTVVRVDGSTSKAQNVNAVLHMARGEFTGMFDADHQPRPGSFERAWRWLANGYDVVQGHCLTRNGEETMLARMIAVEFESIYAVAHPGRARLHRFGVFGGSNGYWRTELLHETRMRGSMLTEDIDSSMRTVERGLKIRSDRDIVSRELATTTFKQVWNQRLRWAQGWFQVTIMHTRRVWHSPGLTLRQKVGASYLLGWREAYPWLSLQVIPLVAFWIFVRGDGLTWGWPILFCTTVFVLHIGPAQTLYAYRLADEEIKQHKRWFWAYLVFSTVFYTEYKNLIARVAHIKEFIGERAWKVTPRTSDPIEFEDDVDDELEPDQQARTQLATAADDPDATVAAPRPVFADRPVGDALSPAAVATMPADAESKRLNQAVTGLLATPGITGEPLVPTAGTLPRRPVDSARRSRQERQREVGPPPVGEPLLDQRATPSTRRSIDEPFTGRGQAAGEPGRPARRRPALRSVFDDDVDGAAPAPPTEQLPGRAPADRTVDAPPMPIGEPLLGHGAAAGTGPRFVVQPAVRPETVVGAHDGQKTVEPTPLPRRVRAGR